MPKYDINSQMLEMSDAILMVEIRRPKNKNGISPYLAPSAWLEFDLPVPVLPNISPHRPNSKTTKYLRLDSIAEKRCHRFLPVERCSQLEQCSAVDQAPHQRQTWWIDLNGYLLFVWLLVYLDSVVTTPNFDKSI